MNNRFKIHSVLLLLVVLLGAAVFCSLSCSQTLPVQQEVSVFVYDYNKDNPSLSEWVDYDQKNGTSKVVMFPGSKFSRTLPPQKFDIEASSMYKLYSFDGKTFSLSSKLENQSVFEGTIPASQAPRLYAYYDVKMINKHPVELWNQVKFTKYVNIPSTYNGERKYLPQVIVKLNDGYTFNTDLLSEGSNLPEDWELTKVAGISYVQGKLNETKDELTVYLFGTPRSSQEEVNIIKLEIPTKYIVDPKGEIGNWPTPIKADTGTWSRFIINLPPFSATDITVPIQRYTSINTTIKIKADEVAVLTDSMGETIDKKTAQFDEEVLKQGTVIINNDGTSNLGWKIEPVIKGLTYSVDSLNVYKNELTLRIQGIPEKDSRLSGKVPLKITMPENVVLYASSASPAVKEGDTITVRTARSFVEISDTVVEVTKPAAGEEIKAVERINIPETSAQEVKITIKSGATFNKQKIVAGTEVPIDLTPDGRETSKWKFPTRSGLIYKFGTLSDNDKTVTIKIFGTLNDGSPYTATPDDIEIPDIYFNGGVESTSRISVQGDENIKWNYSRVSASVGSSAYASATKPIKGVRNVAFNNGEGFDVQINLDGAVFSPSLTDEKISKWFTNFEKEFNSYGSFKYKAIAGAQGGVASPYVLVNIQGVSLSDTVLQEAKGIELNIPYTDINGATKEFGSLNPTVYYVNDTVKIAIDDGVYYGHQSHPLSAKRGSHLTSDSGTDGQEIQLILTNAQFDDENLNSISEWFAPLSVFGSNLTYSYTSLSADKTKLTIKVTGTPDSSNTETSAVVIKLPSTAIRGASESLSDISVQVFYSSSSIVASLLSADNLYGTSTKPVSGIRYAPLSSSEGDYVRVRVYLDGGKFVNTLTNDNVTKWFAAWTGHGISNASYELLSLSSDRTTADVAIRGVLTVVPDMDNYSAFALSIPSTDIENADFISPVQTTLFYHTTDSISVGLSDTSLGSEASPITGVRYISLDDGGIDITILLKNSEFNTSVIDNSVVTKWFAGFVDIIRPVYTIKELTNNLITINIKGALSSPVSEQNKSFSVVVSKNSIKGGLVEDLVLPVYYRTTSLVSATFETQNTDKYFGSSNNPIQSVQYAPINSGKGILTIITLNGARFVAGLSNNVEHWFEACKDYITGASYTIEEGGAQKSYAVVRIKGGFVSANGTASSLSVNISSTDIEGYLPSDVQVQNGFAYQITDVISGAIDSSSVYKGSEQYPITGTIGVELNNSEGYPVRIALRNSVFSSSLSVGQDVESWFNAFTNLSSTEIKISEISERRDAITVLVKGILTKQTATPESIFIKIPPDAIQGYLPASLPVSLFYVVNNSVTAAFAMGEGTDSYAGTTSNPFSTIQHISRSVQMKVVLSGAKFANITSSSVEKWFEAFKPYISPSNATYELLAGGEDTSYAIIKITGALNTDNLTPQKIMLSIPKGDIKNAALTEDIPLEMTYAISDVVSAIVSEDGESNFGSIRSPFTGTRHIRVLDPSGEEGKFIRIQLSNAKFVKNLSSDSNIQTWFKNWTTLTHAVFSIAGGGAGEDFIVIRAKGILTVPTTTESQSVMLEIDKNAIEGYLTENIQTPLYYKTTAEVSALLDSVNYLGTQEKPIKGTYGIRINNGDGEKIRIQLTNGAVFNDSVTVGSDVKHWFSSLTRILAPIPEGEEYEKSVSYTVTEGGTVFEGDKVVKRRNFVEVLIKGAYIASVSDVPYPYSIDIAKSDIYGELPSAISVNMYFMNEKTVKADFVGAEGSDYYGSISNPIDGVSYVNLSYSNIKDSGLNVTIQLNENVYFKTDPTLLGMGPSVEVAKWFKNWTDSVLDSRSACSYEIINGGSGANFITINIKGAMKIYTPQFIGTTDSLMSYINISPYVIDGFLTDNVNVELHYRATKQVSVSVDSGSEYQGSAAYPIAEKKQIDFGEGNGVLLRLNFANGILANTINNGDDVTEWFKSLIAPSSLAEGFHNASFIIERITDSRNALIIRVKGNLLTDSIKGIPSEVVVPNTVIEGFLTEPLTTSVYYCKTNDVTAYVSADDGYFGSSTSPISGIQFVNLADAKGGDGQDVKIYLNGGKFTDSITDADVAEWFAGFDDNISSDRTYTIKYGKGTSELTLHITGSLIYNPQKDASDSYIPKTYDILIKPSQIQNASFTDNIRVTLTFNITGTVAAHVGSETDSWYGTKDTPIRGIKYVPLNLGNGEKLHIELENAVFRSTPTSEELKTKWFESFRTLINSSFTIVGGGENKNYVDILIKGALQTDKTTDPTPVNVVIPNSAIKWNTQYEDKDILVTLYYHVEDTVSASLETASGYFGSQTSPITGIKYMPLNNGNGYEVKINLKNARFKADLDSDAIASWFGNFTEMKSRKIEPRPLPTDRSYVLVNITGSLTSDVKYDVNSNVVYNQNVELVIPKDAIDAYLTEDVRLRLYYGTSGEVEAEIKADNIEFFGSQDSPISGVQYLPLGDSGNGVQVRIALKNTTFSTITTEDVKKWFVNFTEITGRQGPSYTIIDGKEGSNVVVVKIEGGLTVLPSDGKRAINVQISKDNITGDLESDLIVPLYYQTTNVITAELDSEYDGTDSNPIEGVKYIDIANGKGTTIKINLNNNAVFSRTITNESINSWFVNMRELIGPVDDPSPTTPLEPVFTVLSGGEEGDSYITIRVRGALTSTVTAMQNIDIVIPTDCINAYLPANSPVRVRLYYKTAQKVVATFEAKENIYYGSPSNPLKGVRYINFVSNTGMLKTQAFLQLENAKFSTSLSTSDVTSWFGTWTNISSNATYTIDGGGAGESFVIIGIAGALTLETAAVPTIFTLTIPAKDIMSAHVGTTQDISAESVTADFYYQADKNVKVVLSSEEYIDDTGMARKYVGNSTNPIALIQNISIGHNKGERIKLTIENATFNENFDQSHAVALLKNFTDQFTGADIRFHKRSALGDYVLIDVVGIHKEFSDPSTRLIDLIVNDTMINNASAEFRLPETPRFSVYNPSQSIVTLTVLEKDTTSSGWMSKIVGTLANKIPSYPNTPLGNGEGILLGFRMNNARFADVALDSESLQSWFVNLNRNLGNNLQYAYEPIAGTGPGTDTLVVRVSGQSTATVGDAVQVEVSNNFIAGASTDFNTLVVPVYYEIVSN